MTADIWGVIWPTNILWLKLWFHHKDYYPKVAEMIYNSITDVSCILFVLKLGVKWSKCGEKHRQNARQDILQSPPSMLPTFWRISFAPPIHFASPKKEKCAGLEFPPPPSLTMFCPKRIACYYWKERGCWMLLWMSIRLNNAPPPMKKS